MLRKRILTAAIAVAIAAGTAVVVTTPADATTGANVAIFVDESRTLRVVDLAPANGPTLNLFVDSFVSIKLESSAPLFVGAGCTADADRRGKAIARCNVLAFDKTRFDLGGGNDKLSVSTFTPVEVFAGTGNDTINLNAAAAAGNQIFGEQGIDIIATTVAATIDGGTEGDTITGSNKPDDITGGHGQDTITGGQGNDTIRVKGDNVIDDVNCGAPVQDRISMDSFDRVRNCEIQIL